MIQIINYFCSKCNAKVPKDEKMYELQLIDRDDMRIHKSETVINGKNHEMVTYVPSTLWGFALCKKCFDEFNSQMRFPYK